MLLPRSPARKAISDLITLAVIVGYSVGYFFYIGEVWSSRGMEKPWWLDWAMIVYVPAMLIPFPFVGSALVGYGLGRGLSELIFRGWDARGAPPPVR